VFAKAAALHAASLWPGAPAPLAALRVPSAHVAAAAGLAGVLCSAMIYAATRRSHWNGASTGFKFLGTTGLLGAAATCALPVLRGGAPPRAALFVVLALAACKLAYEAGVVRHLRDRQHTTLKRVALLMVRDLRGVTLARFVTGGLGGVALPAALLHGSAGPAAAVAMLVLLLAGELAERHLFFTAAPPSHMPGALA
jgi:DMSO reductase anchor subunit